MKKRKLLLKYFTVTIAMAVIAILVITLLERHNMKRYFDNWIQETDEKIVHILSNQYIEGEFYLNLEDYVDGSVEEIYCIHDERIYFCYSTAIQNSYPHRTWHIASIKTSGERLTEHYSGNMFYKSNNLKYSPKYVCLSYQSNTKGSYGGGYSNNKIFLYGKDISIVYDIDTNTVSEYEGYPINKYEWVIEDHKIITIKDKEHNKSQIITLESLSKQNPYARKMLELSTQKIWDGDSPIRDLFQQVKIVDNQIYIICEVLNWGGESFAVIFQYDFLSSNVSYVSSHKVGDSIVTNYSFVTWE